MIWLAVAALTIGSCGGVSEEVSAFCADYVEVDQLLSQGPDEEDPAPWVEGVTTGLEDLKISAPDEVSAAVTRMADSLLGPISELDEEAFFAVSESEAFLADSAVVNEYIGSECGFETVDVTGVNYAYAGDLAAIEPGTLVFNFENSGSELHEMALIRINDDVTETLDELLELPEEEAEAKTTFAGVAFAAPGESDTLFADLEQGRYAIICFIPVGATTFEEIETAEGPPHFTQGMVEEFTVGS